MYTVSKAFHARYISPCDQLSQLILNFSDDLMQEKDLIIVQIRWIFPRLSASLHKRAKKPG